MGICNKGNPTTITTCNGISAKLYGPWLRSKHKDNLLFVNVLEEEETVDQQNIVVKESTAADLVMQGAKSFHFCESIEHEVDEIMKAREHGSLGDFQE